MIRTANVFNSEAELSGGIFNQCTISNIVPKVTDGNGNLTCSQIFDNGNSVGINTMGPFNYTWSGGLAGGTFPPTSGTVRLDVDGVTRSLAYIATSDENYKERIEAIKNPMKIISGLQGKTYRWSEKAKREMGADYYLQYGFLAQEVAKVLLEAVIIDKGNKYGINYNAFIPVLVESNKELYKLYQTEKIEIEKLKVEIENLNKRLGEFPSELQTKIIGETSNNKATYLLQNVQNPFGTTSMIQYNVGKPFTNAFIIITDLNGKSIKNYSVKSVGKVQVEIDGAGLVNGIYIYILVINNNIVDSKKMVIAK